MMQTQKLFMEALLRDCLKQHLIGDDPLVQEAATRLTEHLVLEVGAIKEVLRQKNLASKQVRHFVAVSTDIPIGRVS